MREEAAEAGVYEYQGVKYERMQLLTVEDVLVQKRESHTPTKVNTKISTGQQNLELIGTHPGSSSVDVYREDCSLWRQTMVFRQ
jgi:hypothetical protein